MELALSTEEQLLVFLSETDSDFHNVIYFTLLNFNSTEHGLNDNVIEMNINASRFILQ